MIIPSFLSPGNCIGIIAPGRKVFPENIKDAITAFESWGLKVKLATHLFSTNHSYLAGTDEERRADLQQFIQDPEVKAIVCARGGYGSSRFIDQVNFEPLLRNPKWLVGFSDVTSIHLCLHRLGIQSIHGTMPILFSNPESHDSTQHLKKILFGQDDRMEAIGSPRNKPGEAKGQLIGGNLSLIIDSLGTPAEPDTTKKILVIEEVEEYLYKIDRMMNHLKRAKKFESLAGLVVGHFTNTFDTELRFGESVQDIILHHVNDFSFPVAFNFPTGHENPNMAWRQGSEAFLTVGTDSSQLQSRTAS